MIAICPNDATHDRFVTAAHEVHDWEVDPNGNFVTDAGCSVVTHRPYPGNGNTWSCKACGADAKFIEP